MLIKSDLNGYDTSHPGVEDSQILADLSVIYNTHVAGQVALTRLFPATPSRRLRKTSSLGTVSAPLCGPDYCQPLVDILTSMCIKMFILYLHEIQNQMCFHTLFFFILCLDDMRGLIEFLGFSSAFTESPL